MNNHFAELGDVWKHLPLAEILHVDPPRAYWETHAGSASYPLTESPSRLHGALRFLSLAPYDPDLGSCAYLAALRHEPGVYPGTRGAWGCGVVLANATETETRICERLGRGLERISEGDLVEGNDPSRLSFNVIA